MKRVRIFAALAGLLLVVGGGVAQAATAGKPINREFVRTVVKGGYNGIDGSHGPIRWTWGPTKAVGTWSALSGGFNMKARVTATRPYQCVYSMRIQVSYAGAVQADKTTELRHCG
jgi:hypothetical protein